MSLPSILQRNRIILCHFDGYSTALRFVLINGSVMLPNALPEDAQILADPVQSGDQPKDVLFATLERFQVQPEQIELQDAFSGWVSGTGEAIQIHLAKFSTFEAPQKLIAPLGGIFKPISELRRLPSTELIMLRQAFNLMLGA